MVAAANPHFAHSDSGKTAGRLVDKRPGAMMRRRVFQVACNHLPFGFLCALVFLRPEHLTVAVFPAVVFLVVIHDAAFVFDTDAALADDFDVADDGDVL